MSESLGPAAVVQAINSARRVGDFDSALAHVAPEALDQGRPVNREDWQRKWEQLVAAIPDIEIITEASVENGDWVANRYTVRGTHTGDLFGKPPTGQRFEIVLMDMVRVTDGRLVEHWMTAEPI
ncbi:ester cyclase [Streptomyces sp. NPDC004752]|uniref:ester cyclase n=1 Tax=Streptomyces scopuliridis TaxID=452529 RepID=UPI00368707E7